MHKDFLWCNYYTIKPRCATLKAQRKPMLGFWNRFSYFQSKVTKITRSFHYMIVYIVRVLVSQYQHFNLWEIREAERTLSLLLPNAAWLYDMPFNNSKNQNYFKYIIADIHWACFWSTHKKNWVQNLSVALYWVIKEYGHTRELPPPHC